MNEIYAELFTRLTTDLSVEVFDQVPQDNYNFPYVRLDPLDLSQMDTDLELGFIGELKARVYSRYEGSKEIAELQQEIYDSLNRFVVPDTTNFAVTTIDQEVSRIVLDSDGETRIGVQRFKIIFEELP